MSAIKKGRPAVDAKQYVKGHAEPLSDILQHEGIRKLGYGLTPKFLSNDTDLRAEDKAVYGYLCARANRGECYPTRNTILKDLQISKTNYYKSYNALLAHGYLQVRLAPRTGQRYPHNIYTIVENPKKFREHAARRPETGGDRGRMNSMFSSGYGFIPKSVMIDQRLHIKAKAIYQYICSYSGADGFALPGRDLMLKHLSMSADTFTKYLRQLTDCGYLSVEQTRTGGRYSYYCYTIEFFPGAEDESSVAKIPDPVEWDTEDAPDPTEEDTQKAPHNAGGEKTADIPYLSDTAEWDPAEWDPAEWDAEKEDTNINSLNINSLNITSTNTQSINPINDGLIENKSGKKEPYEEMFTLVQDQLDVPYLKYTNAIKDPELFDTIIALIARTYGGKSRPVRIDGVEIPLSAVQYAYRKLSGGDVLAVIDSVSSLKSTLRSPTAYLASCLYNAALTTSLVSQIEYNRDAEERFRPDEDEFFDYTGPLRPLPLDQMPNYSREE